MCGSFTKLVWSTFVCWKCFMHNIFFFTFFAFDTRGAAQGILPAVCDFTFLCYLYFWADILEEVNLTQQYLQTKGLSLDKVVTNTVTGIKTFPAREVQLLSEAYNWTGTFKIRPMWNFSREKIEVQEENGRGTIKRWWTHSARRKQ